MGWWGYLGGYQNYYLRSRYFSPLRGGFTQQDSYMGNSQDPITLHKYLYANGNPVMNIDPSGYFSMMSVSGAMGIQNTLQNMKIGAYSNFTNVITGGWDGVSLDDIPALLRTLTGVRLAKRFLPKLFKNCPISNSFDGTTLVSTEKGLVPIQEIEIEDKVWAYNEDNKTKSLQEVTHLIKVKEIKSL
ncbi:MAG: RHS repeat-associated core domain-containing protein [Sulfurovum sp.]|nr:RHS repeat-associated core domain-containing protein [Sulfurovum sp.]